ncbi:hypothetical protein EVAR_7531_1 [Eumeta japonica]|uniref:Uncharacterized protein n=1 Tax=Eumeta variegata TaxID=151549 RepID=A0A4C1VQ48_EUMVA|nr:hypothetical protein EVAR_7531_1 [Eumeta japonica]
MRSRGASCVFALINSRISGGNFRRSEDAGTSLALLDHCPDVVGKSTYGRSISSVDAMSLGMLLRRETVYCLNTIEIKCNSFSECDIYRRGSMCDDMGKHVDVEGDDSEV